MKIEFNDGISRFMTRMDRACKESFFTCRGLSSNVIKNGESIGHVLMIDTEDILLEKVLEMCETRFNNYIVLRSSKNSFHVINPVIRTYDYTYKILKDISIEDRNHADIGYERGDWVLRISDKPNKPMPEIVYASNMMDKRQTFSKPHIKALNTIHDSNKLKQMNKLPMDGKTLRTIQYWTFK